MFRGSSVLVVVLGVVLAGPVFAPAIVSAQQPAAQAPAKAAPAGAGVNLNTATAEQLDSLPGVGPALATRILEYRQKNGGFKKVEELMNIQGIGEKNFLKLKPLVTVTPAKTTPAEGQTR